jgi:hypothetical protein
MELDVQTIKQLFSGPDMDTKQWISYATVEADTPENPSVEFTAEYGPLVNVTLHPSGLSVRARVVMRIAGNGEAEYVPYIAGDEVMVVIPEGNERAGAAIIGRLCNEIDAFPTNVAGADPSKNNFAFTRSRTPFMTELSGGFVLRSAETSANINIAQTGNITLTDSTNAFVHVGADFVGMQTGDGGGVLQIVEHNQRKILTIETNGQNKFTLDDDAQLVAASSLTLAASGIPAVGHVATVEGMVNFVNSVLASLASVLLPIAAPLTGAALAPLLYTAGVSPPIVAGIPLASANSIAPYSGFIQAALTSKQADTTGNIPNLGCPGILAG